MTKTKVALIGHGHLGKWHYEKLLTFPFVEIVAVVEKFPAARQSLLEKFPKQKIVDEVDSVLDQIDCALVVTPTSTHYEIVKKLLSAKKSVFCEKPLTITYENSKELFLLAKKNNLILQVGHSERFHGTLNFIKNSSDYELIKNCNMASFFRHGVFKGRAFDVDVVQDLMIHDLDLVTFLFNDWPKSLRAYGTNICSAHWDHVEVSMELLSGKKIHLSAGRNFAVEKRSCTFTGSNGALEVDLIKHEYLKALPKDGPSAAIPTSKNDHLLVEQQLFFKSIRDKAPVAVDGEQGMRINYLIDQINISLKEDKEITISKL